MSMTEERILIRLELNNMKNRVLPFLFFYGAVLAACSIVSVDVPAREGDLEKVEFREEKFDLEDEAPTYYNEEFSFGAAILPNFNVEYLEENEGMVMKRTVAGEELKKIYEAEWEHWPMGSKNVPDENPYDVEIGITAMKNLLEYEDMGAYLKSECADCTLEFSGDGVFVNEDRLNFAERVYLVMSDDKSVIYRAYLRLPRHRYMYHQKGFDEWVKSIRLY